MGGDITMGSGKTVDGYDISSSLANHETRIAGLEGNVDEPITEDQIPQAIKPFAYGVADTQGSLEVHGAYNLTFSSIISTSSANNAPINHTFTFSTPANSSDYVVLVTPSAKDNSSGTPCFPLVADKTTSAFNIQWFYTQGSTGASMVCRPDSNAAYSILVFNAD